MYPNNMENVKKKIESEAQKMKIGFNKKHGNMETRKHENTETRKHGNMETWKHGNMETWKY